ncbi:hypothetical protein BKA70DRAFT_1424003 [Coprinopsis sp. MPI-PUGE-AT-0042]|nr:hypothetical protein BKA70DRAFT_1424003 [Coprinopsis sp. MPI-PUGE-AT-0042]
MQLPCLDVTHEICSYGCAEDFAMEPGVLSGLAVKKLFPSPLCRKVEASSLYAAYSGRGSVVGRHTHIGIGSHGAACLECPSKPLTFASSTKSTGSELSKYARTSLNTRHRSESSQEKSSFPEGSISSPDFTKTSLSNPWSIADQASSESLQAMFEPMHEINSTIIQCIVATLGDLKRANTSIDLRDLAPSNAYPCSLDFIVRWQLDTVWHEVGPRLKQLVSDLGELRRRLVYLPTCAALQSHAYLDTLLLAGSVTQSGAQKVNHSPWMMTGAADIAFEQARRICFVYAPVKISDLPKPQPTQVEVTGLVGDEDAWATLDDIGIIPFGPQIGSSTKGKDEEKARELTVPVKAEAEERRR